MRKESGLTALAAILLLLLVSLIVLLGFAAFAAGPPPAVTIQPSGLAIGRRSTLRIRASEPRRGLTQIRVELVQAERAQVLAEKAYVPRPVWSLWSDRTAEDEIAIELTRENIPWLKPGTATIRVTAARSPSWLRSPAPVVQELSLPVRLTPPSLQVQSTQSYVAQGGCEAVVYRVGETTVRDGVRVGKRWFPGFPLPGGSNQDRFALFAVPYDVSGETSVWLVAADDVGNEAETRFIDKFFPSPLQKDTIELTEDFLRKVVPSILSQTPDITDSGGLLQNYLKINGDLRGMNARTLEELARKSKPEFLWRHFFLPLRNAKVMSAFADRRTYVYQGRVVDHQDHLGFDLAATRATPIPAANDGVVVMARFFGIYGNTVIIDHGYGLMSLYGHLSSIGVREQQSIRRGEILGKSGDSGLAGGDHLHFSMILHGLPVNPKEWWDAHWIRDRIARKLGAALPFQDVPSSQE